MKEKQINLLFDNYHLIKKNVNELAMGYVENRIQNIEDIKFDSYKSHFTKNSESIQKILSENGLDEITIENFLTFETGYLIILFEMFIDQTDDENNDKIKMLKKVRDDFRNSIDPNELKIIYKYKTNYQKIIIPDISA